MTTTTKDAYNAAIRLLARREHSVLELQQKLSAKGFDEIEIDEAVTQCQQDNYQSDARYAEAYISSSKGRGLGPLRIQHELQQRGVSEEIITDYLDFADEDWFELARQVHVKRFGDGDDSHIQKQKQFLNYRGFTSSQIKEVIK